MQFCAFITIVFQCLIIIFLWNVIVYYTSFSTIVPRISGISRNSSYIINMYYYYIYIYKLIEEILWITTISSSETKHVELRRNWDHVFPCDRMKYYWRKKILPIDFVKEKNAVKLYIPRLYIIWRCNILAVVSYTFLIAINLCRRARVHCAYCGV